MSNNSPIDENKFPDILHTLHQEHWYVTKLLVLLVIICITGLGSISLAQHLLPLRFANTNNTDTQVFGWQMR